MFDFKKTIYVCSFVSSLFGSAQPDENLPLWSKPLTNSPLSFSVTEGLSPSLPTQDDDMTDYDQDLDICCTDSFQNTCLMLLDQENHKILAPFTEEEMYELFKNQHLLDVLFFSMPPRLLWETSELLRIAIIHNDDLTLHQAIMLYCLASVRIHIDIHAQKTSQIIHHKCMQEFNTLLEDHLYRHSMCWVGYIGTPLRPTTVHTPLSDNQNEILSKFYMSSRYKPNMELAIRLHKALPQKPYAWLQERSLFSLNNRFLTSEEDSALKMLDQEKVFAEILRSPNLIQAYSAEEVEID